ncbi:MAG: hypothetical protein EOO46_17540 [Flavobacterium sp.]|nr:MAG: hypothetical protein EOO46_17540 [Flavobacterium sp.]
MNIILKEENTILGHIRAFRKKQGRFYFGKDYTDKVVVWPGMNSFDLFYPIFILQFNSDGIFVKISKGHNPLFNLVFNLIILVLAVLVALRFYATHLEVAITSSLVLIILALFVLIILKKVAHDSSIEESRKLYTVISKYEVDKIVKDGYEPKLKEPYFLTLWTRVIIFPFVIGCIIAIVSIPNDKFEIGYFYLYGILVTYLVSEFFIWYRNR